MQAKQWLLAGLIALGGSTAALAQCVSRFEGDLSATFGDGAWLIDTGGVSAVYTTAGVSEGVQAIEIAHGTNWTSDFWLWGSTDLADAIARSDEFNVDVTVPEGAAWRQVFIVMMGDNQDWNQNAFDVAVGQTTRASLNLATTGIRDNAANGGKSWWGIGIVFQGGDTNGAAEISTTLDSIRLKPSDPSAFTFALGAEPAPGPGLRLSWDSIEGEVYRVQQASDLVAGDWDSAAGGSVVTGCVCSTVATGAVTDAASAFRVEWAAPQVVFFDDFESGVGQWTQGSDGDPGTDWELGLPANGIISAYSGTNSYGTNLDGDYGFNANAWLRSPVIDLTGAEFARLSFQQYRDVDVSDNMYVNILDASGATLVDGLVAENDLFDLDWSRRVINLPSAALGQEIIIEFRLVSDDLYSWTGWYIDDVMMVR